MSQSTTPVKLGKQTPNGSDIKKDPTKSGNSVSPNKSKQIIKKIDKKRPEIVVRTKDFDSSKKGNFCHKDISQMNINELFDYSYLYFRNAEIQQFKVNIMFPNLKLLDLSCNNLTNLSFLENMPFLRHLSLSCNKISSFAQIPPTLHELESLCIGENFIDSFSGLSDFKELKILNVSNNNISSFENYPSLPSLEVLDITQNPIMERTDNLKDLVIALHSTSFRKLNKEEINSREVEQKQGILGGKVAFAVKEGFMGPENVADSQGNLLLDADSHLLQTLKKKVSQSGVPLVLEHLNMRGRAIEGQMLSFCPIFRKKNKDVEILSNTFVEKTFSVQKPTDIPNCEKVYLEIEGIFIEMPKKDPQTYEIELVLPKGTHFVSYHFDEIKEDAPKEGVEVSDASNDNSLATSTASTPTDKTSLVLVMTWLKGKYHGSYEVVKDAKSSQYQMQTTDIKNWIMGRVFCYSNPASNSASEQEPDSKISRDLLFDLYAVTEAKVTCAVPVCLELSIVGECCEGEKLAPLSKYFGGREGKSMYKWTNQKREQTNGMSYEIKTEDIGTTIKLQYTPIREDGLVGAPVEISTPTIRAAKPSISNIQLKSNIVMEGKKCGVSYKYYGGFEGETLFQWYAQEGASKQFSPIEGATSSTFVPTLAQVGKLLKISIVPVSNAEEIGTTVSYVLPEAVKPHPPKIVHFDIVGSCLKQGETLSVEKEYYGGHEGNTKIEWFKRKGDIVEPLTKSVHDFTLSLNEVGWFILVNCTPVRSDGVEGETVSSKTNDPVFPALPVCTSFGICGTFLQDSSLKIETEYYGGIEGKSIVKWYRTSTTIADQNPNENSWDLVKSSQSENINQQESKEYTLSLEDVAKLIKVEYIPIRDDGEVGIPNVFISESVIDALPPVLSNVQVSGIYLEGEKLTVDAVYYGGHEKERNYQWYRITEKGEKILIENSISNTHELTYEDCYCKIICGVQPIRQEGNLEGQIVFSSPESSELVRPILPKIDSIEIEGFLVEGEQAKVLVKGNEYLDTENCLVAWKSDKNLEESNELEVLSEEYQAKFRKEDIGKAVTVHVTPIRTFLGISNDPVSQFFGTILPGPPKALDLVLEGECREGEKLTVSTKYAGGCEGDSLFEWFRSKKANEVEEIQPTSNWIDVTIDDRIGHPDVTEVVVAEKPQEPSSNPDWKLIVSGVNLKEYILQKEDGERMIKVRYTAVRNDGISGNSLEKDSDLVIPLPEPEPEPEPEPPKPVEEPIQVEVVPEPEPEPIKAEPVPEPEPPKPEPEPEPPKPLTKEEIKKQKAEEEKRKKEEEKLAKEEEKKAKEEEKKRLAEEKKQKAEEEKRLKEEEKKAKEEEKKRLAEEKKRLAEEEKKRKEEEKKAKDEEKKRLAEEKKREAEEKKRLAEEEKKRKAEEKKNKGKGGSATASPAPESSPVPPEDLETLINGEMLTKLTEGGKGDQLHERFFWADKKEKCVYWNDKEKTMKNSRKIKVNSVIVGLTGVDLSTIPSITEEQKTDFVGKTFSIFDGKSNYLYCIATSPEQCQRWVKGLNYLAQ